MCSVLCLSRTPLPNIDQARVLDSWLNGRGTFNKGCKGESAEPRLELRSRYSQQCQVQTNYLKSCNRPLLAPSSLPSRFSGLTYYNFRNKSQSRTSELCVFCFQMPLWVNLNVVLNSSASREMKTIRQRD